ncbi:MAG: Rossmann-like and DUF2520 domain-containing protein [Acidobacteriota bacterium]
MKSTGNKILSIIGAGRVGTTLGYLISKNRLLFGGIYSRSRGAAERALRFIGRGKIYRSLTELISESGVNIIAVPDSEIEKLVVEILEDMKPNRQGLRGKIFLHTCGSIPSTVLMPLKHHGANVGSMHPLQSISSPECGIVLLRDSYFCIEGEERAVKAAERIVRRIGGKSFLVNPEDKHAYHLAASLLSNQIVSLADMVMEVLPGRFSKKKWLRIFAPLIGGTAENLKRAGLPDALTGPISRGDVITIREHLKVLREADPALRRLHRILARRELDIAHRQGKLSTRRLAYLRKVIGD